MQAVISNDWNARDSAYNDAIAGIAGRPGDSCCSDFPAVF